MYKSEILEPLHTLVRELIEVDASGKGHLIEYTDDDVMATALLFIHVMGNRKAHSLNRDNISEAEGVRVMHGYGERAHDLVLGMTGVNTQTYYNNETAEEEDDPDDEEPN